MSVMVKNGGAVDEVSVKPASTAAVAADKAMVVAIHPSTNPIVVGTAAHSAAASGNPVRVGGRVQTAVDTTLVAGDTSDLFISTGGAQVVVLNSVPELSWQYAALLTTNTQTAAKAAGAAGIRNYVTDIQLQNTSATATVFTLQDGASTVLWQCSLPASMTVPIDIEFHTPKRGTAATALNYTLGTTGTNTYVNIGGFQAP